MFQITEYTYRKYIVCFYRERKYFRDIHIIYGMFILDQHRVLSSHISCILTDCVYEHILEIANTNHALISTYIDPCLRRSCYSCRSRESCGFLPSNTVHCVMFANYWVYCSLEVVCVCLQILSSLYVYFRLSSSLNLNLNRKSLNGVRSIKA